MDINDLALADAVNEFDELLLSFCVKHKFPALLATSVVLARLLHLNKQAGNVDDFGKLLLTVSQGIENRDYIKPENLH